MAFCCCRPRAKASWWRVAEGHLRVQREPAVGVLFCKRAFEFFLLEENGISRQVSHLDVVLQGQFQNGIPRRFASSV